MAYRDIIVIGASAGGVDTLSELVGKLPADLGAAVFVVLHLSPYSSSSLPDILSRAGQLKAVHPEDGEKYKHGQIYIAPPNMHMLVEGDIVRLADGPRENGTRPAIDPLFRSAAHTRGPRVQGVVLTGNLDDGTAGLASIKRHGGIAICENPTDAPYPEMPRNAILNVNIDYVLPLGEIAMKLVDLSKQPVSDQPIQTATDEESLERIVDRDIEARVQGKHPDSPSTVTCPECGGVIWEVEHDGATRYECRIGHTYSTESFIAEQDISSENALWLAVRTLEERESLSKRIAVRHRKMGNETLAQRFDARAQEAREGADSIRDLLHKQESHITKQTSEDVSRQAA